MKTMLAAGLGPWIPFIVFFVFITLSLLHAAWQRSRRPDDLRDPQDWGAPPRHLEEGDTVEGGTVVRRYVRPSPTVPQPPAPGLPPRPLTPWEADLERILRGESPAPAPPPPPLPVLTPEPPRLPDHPTVEELTGVNLEEAPMPETPLASLASAGAAMDAAASLQDRARDYLSRADRAVEQAAPLRPSIRTRSGRDMKAFVEGLRQPATARNAVLASLVLGRPKALEL